MIYIRVDANNIIASGHVMRCLSIAEKFKEYGMDTSFISVEKDTKTMVEERGFKCILINGCYNNLDGEITEITELIKDYGITKLIIDSYFLTEKYSEVVGKLVDIVYIGSIEKKFTNIKMIVNYSNCFTKNFYECYSDTKLLLGVRYTPLNKTYEHLKNIKQENRVLITTGNTDNVEMSFRLAKKIINEGDNLDIEFCIVVGRMYKKTTVDKLENICKKNSKIKLLYNINDLSEEIAKSKIVITAAGTTLYEVCALNIPTIAYALVDEQVSNGQKFCEDNICYYAGNISREEETIDRIVIELEKMLRDNLYMKYMVSAMVNYIDTKGCDRIVKSILNDEKVMILGAGPLQVPAIMELKNMGYYVIAIDYNPEAIGFNYVDKSLVISTVDEEAVLEAARKYKPNYVFTSTSDAPVRTAAYVNEQLGNNIDISYENAKCATIKSYMRDRLKRCKVAIPQYSIASNYEEYKSYIKELNYRCVVKPADNAGSRGVTLCDYNNVDYSYKVAAENSVNNIIMVEELMEGPEVSVEAITINGETKIITITDKLKTPKPYFVEMGHSEPSRLELNVQESIKEEAIKAIKAIGIVNGPSHTEIILTEDGPKIVEIAARLGGDYITSKLVPLSTGINIVKESIMLATHQKVVAEYSTHKGSAIRFIKSKGGIVKSIKIEKEIYEIDEIKEIEIYISVGDRVNDITSSNDRIGHIIGQSNSAEEAIEIVETAMKYIHIHIE